MSEPSPPSLPPLALPPTPPIAYGYQQTEGLAIASMILGIVGLTMLPFIASIVALVLGYKARAKIKTAPATLTGDGLAVAGIVMGWIGVAYGLVLVLFIGGMVAWFHGGIHTSVVQTNIEVPAPLDQPFHALGLAAGALLFWL